MRRLAEPLEEGMSLTWETRGVRRLAEPLEEGMSLTWETRGVRRLAEPLEEGMSLTWETRGVRRLAEPLPTQRTANRMQRQQRSMIRMSSWYLSQARDKTGQI